MMTYSNNQSTGRPLAKNDQIKTCLPNEFGVRLSQSEAILRALQAGFFEVFFEKHSLLALLKSPACHSVRFTPFGGSLKERTLTAIAVDNNGQATASAATFMVGNGILSPDHSIAARAKKSNFFVDFHCGDLLQLLSAPNAIGLRIFPGSAPGQKLSLIAVGVDERGFDIASGAGYILR